MERCIDQFSEGIFLSERCTDQFSEVIFLSDPQQVKLLLRERLFAAYGYEVHALCVLPCPPGTQRRLARDERLAAAGRVAPPSEPLEPFRGGRLTSERYITPPPAP